MPTVSVTPRLGTLPVPKRRNTPYKQRFTDLFRIVVETLCVVALVAAAVYFSRGAFKPGAAPNPLWIPVVIMSAQYGVLGGVIATLAATATLYGFKTPHRAVAQDFYSYAGLLVAQPLQWLLYAMVIGGLRSLHMVRGDELQTKLDEAHEAANELGDGLERALREIERLECRIAGDSDTLNEALRSLAKLDFNDSVAFVSSCQTLVKCVLGAAEFTIFMDGPKGLEPRLHFDADNLVLDGPEMDPRLWEALRRGRRAIRADDPDGSELLPGAALFAVAIASGLDEAPLGLLLVERLKSHQSCRDASSRAQLLGIALGKAIAALELDAPVARFVAR